MSFTLDASAVLASLLDEPGRERVDDVIDGALFSTVNLAEVVGHLARTGHEEVAISALLSDLPLIIVPPDAAVAMIAGLMRPITAAVGLSLGDRFCLALAKRSEAIAVTADRAWAKLGAMLGVEVELVR